MAIAADRRRSRETSRDDNSCSSAAGLPSVPGPSGPVRSDFRQPRVVRSCSEVAIDVEPVLAVAIACIDLHGVHPAAVSKPDATTGTVQWQPRVAHGHVTTSSHVNHLSQMPRVWIRNPHPSLQECSNLRHGLAVQRIDRSDGDPLVHRNLRTGESQATPFANAAFLWCQFIEDACFRLVLRMPWRPWASFHWNEPLRPPFQPRWRHSRLPLVSTDVTGARSLFQRGRLWAARRLSVCTEFAVRSRAVEPHGTPSTQREHLSK